MADLCWFRLELDAAGKVLSCVEVERAKASGASCIYVQATDPAAARRAAYNAYMRETMARRRAELIAQGKCRCGRISDRPAGKRCSRCLAVEAGYKQRERDKAKGKPVPVLDRKATIAARRDEERSELIRSAAPSIRLAILEEVLQAWQDTPTNGAFTTWLTREIERAGGKRRAG